MIHSLVLSPLSVLSDGQLGVFSSGPASVADFCNHFPGIPAGSGPVHLFLLVCGLRRVKDPLYLVEAFSGEFWIFEHSCLSSVHSSNVGKCGMGWFVHCRKHHHIFTFEKRNSYVSIDLSNTLFLCRVFSILLGITEHSNQSNI